MKTGRGDVAQSLVVQDELANKHWYDGYTPVLLSFNFFSYFLEALTVTGVLYS